jgi:hypothetical protein
MFSFLCAIIFKTRIDILPDIDVKVIVINIIPQNYSINRTSSSLMKFYDTLLTDALIVVRSWSSLL